MNKSNSLNKSEVAMSKLYVFLFWGFTTFVSCMLVAWVNLDVYVTDRKAQTITRIERVKNFRTIQSAQMADVDSLYGKVNRFNPGLYAQYEETEIKLIANDLKSIYDANSQDKRYEMFVQAADLYTMWLTDKKKLWGKLQNIEKFSQDLQDCEIGLQRVQDKLKMEK